MSKCTCLKKKAFAVVSKNGKLQANDDDSLCIYATKEEANANKIEDNYEEVVRVSICLS
jgi:hypothetical protein